MADYNARFIGLYLGSLCLGLLDRVAMRAMPVDAFFRVYLGAVLLLALRTLAKNRAAPPSQELGEPTASDGNRCRRDNRIGYSSTAWIALDAACQFFPRRFKFTGAELEGGTAIAGWVQCRINQLAQLIIVVGIEFERVLVLLDVLLIVRVVLEAGQSFLDQKDGQAGRRMLGDIRQLQLQLSHFMRQLQHFIAFAMFAFDCQGEGGVKKLVAAGGHGVLKAH